MLNKALLFARVFGALAIGASGVLSALGYQDWAQITMILGTAAAAPEQR